MRGRGDVLESHYWKVRQGVVKLARFYLSIQPKKRQQKLHLKDITSGGMNTHRLTMLAKRNECVLENSTNSKAHLIPGILKRFGMYIKEVKCHARRRHPKDLPPPPKTLLFAIRRRGAGPGRDRVVSGHLTLRPGQKRGTWGGWGGGRHYHKSHSGSCSSPAWHYLDPVATTSITSRSSSMIRRRRSGDAQDETTGQLIIQFGIHPYLPLSLTPTSASFLAPSVSECLAIMCGGGGRRGIPV